LPNNRQKAINSPDLLAKRNKIATDKRKTAKTFEQMYNKNATIQANAKAK
jgi:hypothetical protein